MHTGNLALDRQLSRWYPLKDHTTQLELVGAVHSGTRFPLVPAGRRCLEAGTLVATPSGPKPIESLSIGDEVIGFNGGGPEVTTVSETHYNGMQEVIPLLNRDTEYLAATNNHKLWAANEGFFSRGHGGYSRVKVSDLTKRLRVKRAYCTDLIAGVGNKVNHTYALGAFLGDGCCREGGGGDGMHQKGLSISSPDSLIPSKIAAMLGCEFVKRHENNHTYYIKYGLGCVDAIPYYREWAHNRYSHEKMVDLSVVDSWDKESALSFLAGVLDTDGSIYFKTDRKKEVVVTIGMQSDSVIQACSDIIFKYLQERVTTHVDKRDKYKNGFVHYIRTTSNMQSMLVINALKGASIRCDKVDVSGIDSWLDKSERVGLKHGEPRISKTYDITVANDTNLYVLHHGGIVTSNSGKTERFKRFLVKEANKVVGQYFAAAPTHDQAKKIFWQDLKDFSLSITHKRRPSESDRIIFFDNGSEIHVIGLDKPQRIEGIPWKGGGIDEFADIKAGAWEANIYPALSTVNPLDPDYRAWCWLLGVPDGLNHYYDLCQIAEAGDPDFKVFHWKSADILPQDVIDAAKRSMGPKQYRQEYEASFETASGRIYEDYSKENYTDEVILPHEQLHWMHDQNYTPLSSAVGVIRDDSLYLLNEIVLTSAVSSQSAEEFVVRFKDHGNKVVRLYGDPAGRAGEKHGHASDYTDIKKVLMREGWRVINKVKKSHPAIKDRQNQVRARIKNAAGEIKLYINPRAAEWCHKGISTVQLQKGSTFQEDQKNQYQHITTAIGYMVDVVWPINKPVIHTGIGMAR